MKKVIFVTPHFLPHLGGVETHVSQVAKVLAARDWDITVITSQETVVQPLNDKLEYCHVVRIPLEAQSSKKTIWQWNQKYFQKVDEDTIIHIHDVAWWLLPVLLFSNKKYFYLTFHGWEGVYPVRWQAKLHRLVVSKLVRKTIHVGGFIQDFYWDKPNKIIYGGVDLPVKATIVFPQSSSINIVFLGRLEKENSIDSFFQLLTKLTELKLKLHITWVGDGEFRSTCEKWGEVTGMVTNVRRFISSADIVFASSYLSILEAQAQGKIVCALYDNPLKQRYLETFPGKDGLLIAEKPDQLAIKIRKLLDNKSSFLQLSKRSAVFAQSQSWNMIADAYEDLWGRS